MTFFGNFEKLGLLLMDRQTNGRTDRWKDRQMDGQALLQRSENASKNVTTKKQKSKMGDIHEPHQMARNEFFQLLCKKVDPDN